MNKINNLSIIAAALLSAADGPPSTRSCRQVGEELGELIPVLRVERSIHSVQECLLAQPTLSEPTLKFTDRTVAFGIGGTHSAIVVREPVTRRLHTRKYRITLPGAQASGSAASFQCAALTGSGRF